MSIANAHARREALPYSTLAIANDAARPFSVRAWRRLSPRGRRLHGRCRKPELSIRGSRLVREHRRQLAQHLTHVPDALARVAREQRFERRRIGSGEPCSSSSFRRAPASVSPSTNSRCLIRRTNSRSARRYTRGPPSVFATPRSGNSASQLRSTYGWTWAISHTSGCRNNDRFGICTVVTPGMQGAGEYSERAHISGSVGPGSVQLLIADR